MTLCHNHHLVRRLTNTVHAGRLDEARPERAANEAQSVDAETVDLVCGDHVLDPIVQTGYDWKTNQRRVLVSQSDERGGKSSR